MNASCPDFSCWNNVIFPVAGFFPCGSYFVRFCFGFYVKKMKLNIQVLEWAINTTQKKKLLWRFILQNFRQFRWEKISIRMKNDIALHRSTKQIEPEHESNWINNDAISLLSLLCKANKTTLIQFTSSVCMNLLCSILACLSLSLSRSIFRFCIYLCLKIQTVNRISRANIR